MAYGGHTVHKETAMIQPITHLTILTGHIRKTPRSEITQETIDRLTGYLFDKEGILHREAALGDTGWRVRWFDMPVGADKSAAFELSYHHNPMVMNILVGNEAPEMRKTLWEAALRYPKNPGVRLTMPSSECWLASAIMPQSMMIDDPWVLFEAGGLEICIAWALLDDAEARAAKAA